MVFNPAIPRPTDLLSNSQGDLLSNNIALNASFSKNHVPLDVATNNGRHTFVEMVNIAGAPPGTVTGEGTLYTKKPGTSSDLYFVTDNSGNQYQITRVNNANFAKFGAANGFSFLPGNIYFQYGVIAFAGGITPVLFPVKFTSAVYSIQVTAQTTSSSGTSDQTAAIRDGTVSLTGFSINSTSSGNVVSFNWIAVGV